MSAFDVLLFARKYPHKWHSYSDDMLTGQFIAECVMEGLIETNEFKQFRYKEVDNATHL